MLTSERILRPVIVPPFFFPLFAVLVRFVLGVVALDVEGSGAAASGISESCALSEVILTRLEPESSESKSEARLLNACAVSPDMVLQIGALER